MSRAKIFLWDTLRIITGSLMYSVGLQCFALPHGFVLGGAGGVATVLNILWRFPIGLSSALLNLPILILAVWKLGVRSTLRTAYATMWFTLALGVGEKFFTYTYRGEPLLAAVLGGLVMGVGLILVYVCECTTGGSDLLAKVLAKQFPRLSFSKWILLLDGSIVLFGSIALGSVENAVYSVLMILVYTRVFEAYFTGKVSGKVALIVTDRCFEVRSFVVETLGRGCTEIIGVGGYTGRERRILFCALSERQMGALRRYCAEEYPDTFITVLGAEIWGEGFMKL